jgi:hypothetical protein
MRDNETFYWQALFPIAAGVAIPLLLYFLALPPAAFAVAVIAVTALLLLWHASAVRANRGPGHVLLARPPWVVLFGAVLLLVVAGAMYLFPLNGDSVWWYFLAIFLGVMVYSAYLPTALLFWIATPEGLTRQALSFKKSLPWSQIDWIYAKRKQVSQSALEVIPVASWTEETVFVEAGPKRRIVVVMRAPLVRGDARPLLAAIQRYATHARFGFDQYPDVAAQRSARTTSLVHTPADPSPGRFDPAQAAALGRGEVVPSGWTRFPLRRRNAWQNALGTAIVGLVLLGGTAYLYLTGVFLLADFVPLAWRSAQTTELLLIAQTAVLGVALVVLTLRGLWWFEPLRHLGDYFFLVTPQGFLEVRGAKTKGAAFADVRGVRLGGGDFGWQLVATLRSGEKLALDIGNNYGPGRELYAYVLAALNASRGATASARRDEGLGAALDMEVESSGG